MVRALELAYGCTFVRKEWHEGTPDGRPTPFHLAISAPEAGHVTPKVRALQVTPGFAITLEGRLRTHRVAIRIPKGVDVALALAMVQDAHHHKKFDEYGLVVVVTGDGDLEEAFERASRRVVVCGSREGLAPALRPWVRSEGNQGLYLDEVLVGAQMLAAEEHAAGGSGAGTGVAQQQHQQHQQLHHHHQHQHQHQQLAAPPGLGAGGMHKKDALSSSASSTSNSSSLHPSLTTTGNGSRPGGTTTNSGMGTLSATATTTNSSNNNNMVDSPLSSSPAYGSIPTSGDLRAERWKHQVLQQQQQQQHNYQHQHQQEERALNGPPSLPPYLTSGNSGGSNGSASTHGRQKRRKSFKLRLRCFAGPMCTKLKDEDHLRRTTHPCPAGLACRVLCAVETPDTILHMERFLHPCPRGSGCLDESFEHLSLFEHVGRNVLPLCTAVGCRGGGSGGGIIGAAGAGGGGMGRGCGSEKDRQMTEAAVQQYHGGVPHRHICPHGRHCSFLAHSVADKRVIRHTASFIHPCPWGGRCVARKAETWNWQHMLQFTHFAEDDEQVQREREEEEGKEGVGGREGRDGREEMKGEREEGRMEEKSFFSPSLSSSSSSSSSSSGGGNNNGRHGLNQLSPFLHHLPPSGLTASNSFIAARLQAQAYAHALAAAQHSPPLIAEERRDVNAGMLSSSSSSSFSSEGGDHFFLGGAVGVAAGKGGGGGEGGRGYHHHGHHHTASSLGRGGADGRGGNEDEEEEGREGGGEEGGGGGQGKDQFLISSFSSSLLPPAYQNIW